MGVKSRMSAGRVYDDASDPRQSHGKHEKSAKRQRSPILSSPADVRLRLIVMQARRFQTMWIDKIRMQLGRERQISSSLFFFSV